MAEYEIRKDEEELQVITNEDGTVEIGTTDWFACRSISIMLTKDEAEKLKAIL